MVALVLCLWTASLTVTFLQHLPTLPWYVPYTALVAFDGGMIASIVLLRRRTHRQLADRCPSSTFWAWA